MQPASKPSASMTFFSMTKTISIFARPFLAYTFAGKITPVLAGYKITHRCNLSCLHCPYWERSDAEQNFSGVLVTMERLKRMGVRILILEGGEPLLWRDGDKTILDVVREARKLFPSVCMTTNGTLPWNYIPLDRVWVSIDGPPGIHDSIRGDGAFNRAWENLKEAGDNTTLVSTTINQTNMNSIPELLTMLRGRTAGMTIQFHYPYRGLPDPLFIPVSDRSALLDELIQLKHLGYPVANSVGSLQEMKKDRWTCEDRLLANAEPDGTIHQGCYLKNRGPAVCSLCGFTAHNEMSLAFKRKWQSVQAGTRIFFGGSQWKTLP